MKNKPRERGQALLLIVFVIIGLVAMTGLAVDGGRVYLDRRRAQTAADAAALGASLARIHGADWINSALTIADQNGFNNDGKTNSIVIVSPPVDGPYQDSTEYLQVVIATYTPMSFASVIGTRQINSTVQAIARTKISEIAEILDGAALVSLAPTSDCNTRRAFSVEGEATLDIWDADIFVNSNNRDCAFIQKGSGSIVMEGEGGDISVVGGLDIQKPDLITPDQPVAGKAPISYPPPFFMPNVGCHKEAVVSDDGGSMTAGSWGVEDFPPSGVHSLEAGMYCLGGDFIINGGDTLEGNNVVIEVKFGKVRWSGDATITLKGRNAGDLAGLLLLMPIENHNRIVINGDSHSIIRGTILAPGAEIHINGLDSDSGFHSQIIGYRINVNGQSLVRIKYQDDQNYDAMTMPEISLIK